MHHPGAVSNGQADPVEDIGRDLAPIGDMQRRGWIKETSDARELEAEVCRFLDVGSLDEEPVLSVSARKSDATAALSKEQRAWAFRARRIAR